LAQHRETPRTVDEAAAAWAARMDRGPLSEQDAETLEAWLEEDSRRLGALMRARAIYSRTESAWSLEPIFNPSAFKRPRGPTRRRVLGWGAGGAVAASVGAALVGYSLTATRSYATERGEVRQVPLADGANLTLNTLSEVQIRARSDDRDIRVITGEVLLALADGSGETCTLRIGDWRLDTSGGSIFVSRIPDRPTEVTVHRGRVVITGPDATRVRLDQGRRLVLAGGPGLAQRVETLAPDQLERELAWRDGQLAFHDDTLASAAAAFARYSRQPIVIRDPALETESVSGLFAANDPAGFAQAIGLAFDVAVRVEPDRILIG